MTAVEYLIEKWYNGELNSLSFHREELFQQAKEMEKQQIIDANSNGWHDGQEVIMNKIKSIDFVAKGGDDNGEQYFTETYGSKGSDNLPKVQNKDSFGEISDDEIEKAVNNPMHDAYDFREGAMWYREQLKQRQ